MKFFGSIAHYYPKEIFEKYPVLLQCLFDAIDTDDETILPVALDTLGFIGKKTEGKLCLAAVGNYNSFCTVIKYLVLVKLLLVVQKRIQMKVVLLKYLVIYLFWHRNYLNQR